MSEPQQAAGTIRSVIVVGGGTAGYLTALALRHQLPHLDITLLESSKIPIIGVGEATTTLMPPFLHRQLGIDIVELYRQVRPTWKLGIKFEWGLPGDYRFYYPFGTTSPLEAYAQDGQITNQSLCALMMASDRVPMVRDEDGDTISLLPYMKFAYHLDNKTVVAYLAQLARRVGIRYVDATIKHVATTVDGGSVDRVILDDERELRGDLYVDASGFRALLIEKTLGSPFTSFSESLFCDSAVVGEVPQQGAIEPYTTAETMDAGWCWRIPVEGEDHRGYVYSSAHLTDDQARAEMRAKNPTMGDTWSLRFRSGRHCEFWKGNTVAVGNAYGFVEPLQSTALHMVIIETAYLIGCLRHARGGAPDRSFANKAVGAHWDYLRWFLAIHYKFNRRSDTQFWRDCRESVDVSGMQPLLERYSTLGPWADDANLRYAVGDPAFSFEGLMLMLLGQHAPCPPLTRTALPKAQWNERVAKARALVAHAFTQAQALDLLRRRPQLLQDVATAGNSWINLGAELIDVSPGTGIVHPKSDPLIEQQRPYADLLEGVVLLPAGQ
jgi:tryptophan 7-halogenase